jgi:hypothetical protein
MRRAPRRRPGRDIERVPEWAGEPRTARAHALLNFRRFSNLIQRPTSKIVKVVFPASKNIWEILGEQISSSGTTLLIFQTSKSKQILNYKFRKFLKFEIYLNFKGVQTFWEKSHKLTKIIICQVLQNYNFRSHHLYSGFPCSFTSGIMNTYRNFEKVQICIGLMTLISANDSH